MMCTCGTTLGWRSYTTPERFDTGVHGDSKCTSLQYEGPGEECAFLDPQKCGNRVHPLLYLAGVQRGVLFCRAIVSSVIPCQDVIFTFPHAILLRIICRIQLLLIHQGAGHL